MKYFWLEMNELRRVYDSEFMCFILEKVKLIFFFVNYLYNINLFFIVGDFFYRILFYCKM